MRARAGTAGYFDPSAEPAKGAAGGDFSECAAADAGAIEYLHVRFRRLFIEVIELLLVAPERVHVFHQEFASAQYPRFCAELPAELVLYLVDRFRQIAIGRHLSRHDARERLFV